MAPDLFMVHNLKGAVFTKMRMFPDARKAFHKASELHPTSFHPKFNLAEIEFVEAAAKARAGQGEAAAAQFASAQKMFEALIAKEAEVSTRRLMEFKVAISLLKQGKEEEAEKMVKAFSYIDDEPVYYLGHAAIEFHRGDKPAAQEWIDSANRIYAPQQITIYMDSFIEVGWVETLAL
jgi:tetratricopeptide (TPR) repeat protein